MTQCLLFVFYYDVFLDDFFACFVRNCIVPFVWFLFFYYRLFLHFIFGFCGLLFLFYFGCFSVGMDFLFRFCVTVCLFIRSKILEFYFYDMGVIFFVFVFFSLVFSRSVFGWFLFPRCWF